jgi:hypothetical protein
MCGAIPRLSQVSTTCALLSTGRTSPLTLLTYITTILIPPIITSNASQIQVVLPYTPEYKGLRIQRASLFPVGEFREKKIHKIYKM